MFRRPYLTVAGLQLAARASAGAAASLAIAQLAGLQYPMFAAIAAVIVTDLSPAETEELGKRRIVATTIGVIAGVGLGLVLPVGIWSIGLSVFLAMIMCSILGVQDAARMAGYVCGIVVVTDDSLQLAYAFFRFIETMIGIVVAWLISRVPKLLKDHDDRAD